MLLWVTEKPAIIFLKPVLIQKKIWLRAVMPIVCQKMKDCSRLQAVTYTVKVVLSQKWCKIDTLLLHTTTHWFLQYAKNAISIFVFLSGSALS